MKKELVEENYNISIDAMVKITSKTYKIFTSDETFLLKMHDDEYIENIFVRLNMLQIDVFHLPILTVNGNYILYDEDKRYALYHYYDDETILNKDIRLHFFIVFFNEFFFHLTIFTSLPLYKSPSLFIFLNSVTSISNLFAISS